MNHDMFYKIVYNVGIIPVAKIEDPDFAVPLAKALIAGGINILEVTFRTSCAVEAMRRIKQECPDMLLGAGTVLTTEQADQAQAAGAVFCVAPGLNPMVTKHCLDGGMLMLPGAVTPSEIEQGLAMGLDVFKFFPAQQSGGIGMLKALHGPYDAVRFVPTGGINQDNIEQYLSIPYVLAVGGSFVCESKLMREGNFAEIQRLAATVAALAARVRG